MTVVYFNPPTVPIDMREDQMDDEPIFKEVVAELGFDPTDSEDKWNDEYNLATQYHQKAMDDLNDLVRAAYLNV